MKKLFLLVAALIAVFAATAQDANSTLSNSSKPDKIAFNNAIIFNLMAPRAVDSPLYYFADLSFDDFEYAVALKKVPFVYKFGELVADNKYIRYDVPLEYDPSKNEYLVGEVGLDPLNANKLYGYDKEKLTGWRIFIFGQNGKVELFHYKGDFIQDYAVKVDTQGRIIRVDWSSYDEKSYLIVTYDSSNCINMLTKTIRSANSSREEKYVKTGKDTWLYSYTSSLLNEKLTFEILERDEKGRWTKGVVKNPKIDSHTLNPQEAAQREVFRCIDPDRDFFKDYYESDYGKQLRKITNAVIHARLIERYK